VDLAQGLLNDAFSFVSDVFNFLQEVAHEPISRLSLSVTPVQEFSSNGVGLFGPRLSNSADLRQSKIYVIGPAARDSSYFRSVRDDLVDRLAQLEHQHSKSYQHDGLEEERNRGDDYEDGLQRFLAHSPASPDLMVSSPDQSELPRCGIILKNSTRRFLPAGPLAR
jgi:hypothetical protein